MTDKCCCFVSSFVAFHFRILFSSWQSFKLKVSFLAIFSLCFSVLSFLSFPTSLLLTTSFAALAPYSRFKKLNVRAIIRENFAAYQMLALFSRLVLQYHETKKCCRRTEAVGVGHWVEQTTRSSGSWGNKAITGRQSYIGFVLHFVYFHEKAEAATQVRRFYLNVFQPLPICFSLCRILQYCLQIFCFTLSFLFELFWNTWHLLTAFWK